MFNRYKFKRHIKIGRALLVCVSLFIVSACGIPTSIYLYNDDPDEEGVSYYEFSSSDAITSFSLYIDTATYDVQDSPSLCYFYTILETSSTSISDDIIADFESKYADLPGSRLDTYSSTDPYVLTDSSDSYKLYKFTYQNENDSDILDQEYLTYLTTLDSEISDNTTYEETGVISADLDVTQEENDGSYYFTFSIEDVSSDADSSSSQFNTKNADGDYENTEDNTYKLFRFNGDEFKTASYLDEDIDLDYEVIDSTTDYTVIVYVALTVEGDFTNIFWSDLHEVGSFDL